eukprot:TRINITY_DN22540_c0_g1_i2.p1 TRINITY_DN22540_c0_g1~~TRINITY_DN22540_c0_g1_i2.p1  ORF type:complete len:418 (+),score=119.44 TRINITY_DN22540_c0_g1_i2:46-1254(+)
MSKLIAEALKGGKWVEKKGKNEKVYYANKGDDRTKEKTMWAKDFEKFLKEHEGTKPQKDDGKEKPKDDKTSKSLIPAALKTGLWVEKKDKSGKVYYVNKGDTRCKDPSLRPAALEKFLKENGQPKSDADGDKKTTGGKKEEQKKPAGNSQIEEAISTGQWVVKKDKSGKEFYANKGDTRCKEPSLRPAAFEKFLKENGVPKAEGKPTKSTKPEKKEEQQEAATQPEEETIEVLEIEGEFPDTYTEGDDLTEEEKKMKRMLKAAYSKGWIEGKKNGVPKRDVLSQRPRPTVSAPVDAREDWAPVEWPKWQSLLMEDSFQNGLATHSVPTPTIELAGLGLSPNARASALWGAPSPNPYRETRTTYLSNMAHPIPLSQHSRLNAYPRSIPPHTSLSTQQAQRVPS